MSDGTHLPLIPSPDVTLRQLECFVAVAEDSTITGAAARIHSSGSAVSDAVTALERALGVPLMVRRRSQGITLTSTGRSLVPLAREVLASAHELELVARGDEGRVAPVRIGSFHTIAPTIVPPLISKFMKRHPEAEISYVVGEQELLAQQLKNGDLDIAIVYELDFPLEFERVRLVRSRPVVLLPENHPLATRSSVRLLELATEPFVLNDIAPSRQYALDILNDAGVQPPHVHASANYDLCRSLVGEGIGWTILMDRRFSPATWSGKRIVEIPIEPAPQPLGIVAASRAEAHPPRVADLIQVAREASQELMGRI